MPEWQFSLDSNLVKGPASGQSCLDLVEEIENELLDGLQLDYVGMIDEALQHTLSAPV